MSPFQKYLSLVVFFANACSVALPNVGGFALSHSAAVLLHSPRPGGSFGIVRAEGHAEIDPGEAREIVRLQGLAVSLSTSR